jgi:hypothetical protein
MANFGLFRGFSEKLFQGELPTSLGIIGSQTVFDFIGLLDTYPNSEAAFSLRKLREAYSGNCIEVRNDSNVHLNIGFVNNELDTASLLAHCGSGSGRISKWYDQSGFGRVLAQATVANQPLLVSNGSIITLNGRPTIQFNENQFLRTTSFNVTDLSIFTVLNKYTITTWGAYMRNVTASGSSFGLVSSSNSSWQSQAVQFINGSDVQINTSARANTKPLPTGIYLENWIKSVLNTNLFENNNTISIGSGSTGWGTNNTFTIGSINFQGDPGNNKVDLSEMVIYNSNQTSNRSNINQNIIVHYGI